MYCTSKTTDIFISHDVIKKTGEEVGRIRQLYIIICNTEEKKIYFDENIANPTVLSIYILSYIKMNHQNIYTRMISERLR